mmetsp:Transcript_6132/g.12166  ORF Transcript_6132/g.12166 Transcript_6132/m.12166 type:complete len:361 (+) Transcript_6132:316-1398(+)
MRSKLAAPLSLDTYPVLLGRPLLEQVPERSAREPEDDVAQVDEPPHRIPQQVLPRDAAVLAAAPERVLERHARAVVALLAAEGRGGAHALRAGLVAVQAVAAERAAHVARLGVVDLGPHLVVVPQERGGYHARGRPHHGEREPRVGGDGQLPRAAALADRIPAEVRDRDLRVVREPHEGGDVEQDQPPLLDARADLRARERGDVEPVEAVLEEVHVVELRVRVQPVAAGGRDEAEAEQGERVEDDGGLEGVDEVPGAGVHVSAEVLKRSRVVAFERAVAPGHTRGARLRVDQSCPDGVNTALGRSVARNFFLVDAYAAKLDVLRGVVEDPHAVVDVLRRVHRPTLLQRVVPRPDETAREE